MPLLFSQSRAGGISASLLRYKYKIPKAIKQALQLDIRSFSSHQITVGGSDYGFSWYIKLRH